MLDLISMCVVAKHMLLQAGEGNFPFQERALGVSLQSLILTGQENFYLKSFGSLARSIEFPILCFYPFTAVCSSKLHEFIRYCINSMIYDSNIANIEIATWELFVKPSP